MKLAKAVEEGGDVRVGVGGDEGDWAAAACSSANAALLESEENITCGTVMQAVADSRAVRLFVIERLKLMISCFLVDF